MTPTLYADDYYTDDDGEALLVRVLPRRCPRNGEIINQWADHEEVWNCDEGCSTCGGRAWLYPDPPNWLDPNNQQWWQEYMDMIWRVLGIVEDTDE